MSKSFYDNDNDDNGSYQRTIALCVAAASLVVLMFLVILYLNTNKTKSVNTKPSEVSTSVQEEDDFLANSNDFTSGEMNFWNIDENNSSANNDEEGELTPYKNPKSEEKTIDDANEKDATDDIDTPDSEGDETDLDASETEYGDNDTDDETLEEVTLKSETDPVYDDDKHLAVTGNDGKTRYYEILSKVKKNSYDFENNLFKENGVLSYKDSKTSSITGIDLSKYNGTVDWKRVKDSGIDFAMLRLGSRGYGSGEISLDEKFVEYAQNAAFNGIPIGAYFYSQAISESEAVEEANYVVGAIAGFSIKYPVAIDVETVDNDDARTDNLSMRERTIIVKSFCDTVKNYGYKPIIYADRDMLISGLDLEELTGYDVWLADDNVPTDYPYLFGMWQYTTKGKVDGITGDIDMNLSFINYEER